MKTLFYSVATLANVLSVQAFVSCNYEHPGDVHRPGENLTEAIRPFLDGQGLALCNEIVYANSSEVLYYESPHYTFEISRQRNTDTVENCKAAFESIMTECVVEEEVLGGNAYVNEIVYEIYHTELRQRDIESPELDAWMETLEGRDIDEFDDDDEDEDYEEDEDEQADDEVDDDDDNEDEIYDIIEGENGNTTLQDAEDLDHRPLEARRGRSGGRRTRKRPTKKRPTKKRPTKKRPTKKKPAKKPTTGAKKCTAAMRKAGKCKTKKPKATACQLNGGKTKTGKGSKVKVQARGVVDKKTGSKAGGGRKNRHGSVSNSCTRQDGLNCALIVRKANAQLKAEAAKNDLIKREEPLSFIENIKRNLVKRGRKAKKGGACGEAYGTFNAESYPSEDMLSNAKYYGWKGTKAMQCKTNNWGGGNGKVTGETYEVEHVLEWQVVTKFFDWISKDKHSRRKLFTDPDPKSNGAKIDFCDYWKKTWDTPAFTIPLTQGNNPKGLTAKEHLAKRFPGKDFMNEFVMLHDQINAPAKAEMWKYKKTNNIYDLTKSVKAITGAKATVQTAAEEAVKVKYLLGAVRYMKDSTVEGFLVDQKQRIGDALDEIDTALTTAATNGGLHAWQRQGLKALWDEYMDEAFKKAKSRTDHTMETMLKALEKRTAAKAGTGKAGGKAKASTASNDLTRTVKALRSAWNLQNRATKAWKKPNW